MGGGGEAGTGEGRAAGVSAADLRVRLLGGLEIEGVPVAALGSRKARMLVSVLALGRGAPVPLDRVVEALWGDEPPARPADQVRVLVSRVRAALGADRVPRRDAGWALRADWVDVVELETRLAEAADRLAAGAVTAARMAVRAALALARGELLPEEDGAWVTAERAAAARLVGQARSLAAEAALAAGDPSAAVLDAEAALDRDPYDEVALRLAMTALTPRYRLFAEIDAALAAARRGEPLEPARLSNAVTALREVAGLESWRSAAALAAATGDDRWWRVAEEHAAAVVAAAGDDRDRIGRWLTRALEDARRSQG